MLAVENHIIHLSKMFRLFFKQRLQLDFALRKSRIAGFTLIELLVAMLIGGMISSALLFLVVQLLQTNLREAARSDTQRDLQGAIDYITRDLREAVYVYDGRCLDDPTNTTECPGLKNYLPARISRATDNVPVLAFWRVDPIPPGLETACEDNANAFSTSTLPLAIQGVPCLAGRMYTLVVYSLNWSSGTSWRGRARIARYELPQFPYGARTPNISNGWADPTSSETDFMRWPLDKARFTAGERVPIKPINPSDGTGGTDNRVLVDFVDKQGPGHTEPCVTTPQDPTPSSTPEPPKYELTPKAPKDNARGFYVCVRGAANGAMLNQEVLVRIHGDAAGRPGIPLGDLTKPQVPIALETRVLTRGVVNKTQ